MPRLRSRTPATPIAPVAVRPNGQATDVVLIAMAIIVACVVFRGALAYFFAQDDFVGLARARGLLPRLPFPWRWLSNQAYFDVMRVWAGLDAGPYHAVSLAAHALCVALVYRLCRRFVTAPAAALGATFFGVHPAMFTAVYWISALGGILALACGLASLLLATRPGRTAWLALPLFAASLLWKESTLLLPLVAFLRLEAPPASRRTNAARPASPPRVARAMTGLSIVYLGAFFARDAFGVRASLAVTAPYALRFDHTLTDNLLTYLGWTVQIALPLVKSFADSVDRGVFGVGVAFAVAAIAGLGVRGLRARGWLAGVALFGLALLPILPLPNHTYHYYLYAPLVGAALLVAALAEVVAGRLARTFDRRAVSACLLIACVALAVNGGLLVGKIESYPLTDPELRSDPTVDRARIAARAIGDLRAAALPPDAQVWFWSPASIGRQRDAGGDPDIESYWESNVRVALYDGLAVRVCLPQVASTRFVRRFEPAGDSVRYALYLPNGHLGVTAPAPLDSALRRSAAAAGGIR